MSVHPNPTLGSRALFPDLAARAYLNHCGISPPSLAVRAAAMAVLDDFGRSGAGAFTRWMAQRARLKGLLAGMIGAEARDLALVANTTQGVIDIGLCFPWRTGDRILCFTGEFPTNVTPWQRAASLFGGEVVFQSLNGFSDGSGDGLARFEALLKTGIRMVAVSAVQFQTGLRMPIAEMGALCRQYGAELFVDAIQAVGVVPLDGIAASVDYLSCGSHKWLMGLEGCAFLYVHPDRAAALRPNVAGWLSHEDPTGFLFNGAGHLRYDRPFKQGAEALECGAFNTVGFAALEASAGILQELGIERIYAHVQAWHDRAEQGLRERGFQSLRAVDPAARSGILSVLPPPGRSLASWVAGLGEAGFALSMPDGVLRMGPHWPNAPDEVEALLVAVDQWARS